MSNTNVSTLPFDVDEIRKRAMQSIGCGALTEDYPLDVAQACAILNAALATEIMCVLRYRQHQVMAKGIDYAEVAAEFAEHAADEAEHMMLLAERINQLGGQPDFDPAKVTGKSAAIWGTAEDLVSMIREDLVAERTAIEVYRKMIQWFGMSDPTTRLVLEKILKDEEEHANDLVDFLSSNSKDA